MPGASGGGSTVDGRVADDHGVARQAEECRGARPGGLNEARRLPGEVAGADDLAVGVDAEHAGFRVGDRAGPSLR